MTRKKIVHIVNENIYSRKIVSRDFSVLFLISLNRYKLHDRAGSGLFFISMMFL
jgi:hypothetical protein